MESLLNKLTEQNDELTKIIENLEKRIEFLENEITSEHQDKDIKIAINIPNKEKEEVKEKRRK